MKEPGVFPTFGRITLLQAVGLAKGMDPFANPRRVAIFRVIDGQRRAAAFDLIRIRRGEADDPSVYAGDTVIVDGSKLKDAQAKLMSSVTLLPYLLAP